MTSGLVPRLKRAARIVLTGRDSAFYEDEMIGFSLKHPVPVRDTALSGRRLNIVTPSISASAAFGGLATLMDLSVSAFKRRLLEQGWQLRFISTEPAPAESDNIARQYMKRLQVPASAVEMLYDCGYGTPVPVGAGDIFLGSLWHIQLAVLPLMRFQHAQFGGEQTPYISLVQDYEPGFHPWSSAYLMAQASYNADWPQRAIFNSEELAQFYKAQGHKVEDSVVFEPVMNTALLDALQGGTGPGKGPGKARRILFYGRPGVRRNCYYLVRSALEIWAETYEEARHWRAVSVGSPHEAFPLAGNVPVEVLGKLSLARYAEELHRAAVGLSLMASPHPSYPPLEMAHFGALTVCNSFTCKDLRTWHENLTPVEIPAAENIAQGLAEACRAFDADPEVGLRGQSLKPHYLDSLAKTKLDDIATLIAR